MTLRNKTLATVGITLVALLCVLLSISYTVLLKGFAELENSVIRGSINRLISVINDELYKLSVEAQDYAVWDDTYNYMEFGNENYIYSNYTENTFTSLNLNLIAILGPNGEIVFGRSYDRVKKEISTIPKELVHSLEGIKDGLFAYHNGKEGKITSFLLLSDKVMLIASFPILTSESQGPARGAVLMGRYFDEAELQRVENLTYLSVEMRLVNEPNLPPHFREALSQLSVTKEKVFTDILDDESIVGYTSIKNISQTPVALFQVKMPRDIYRQGITLLRYVNGFVLASALMFTGILLWLLERLVLARLAVLSEEIKHVHATDTPTFVSVQGNDELTELAIAINSTLKSLEISHNHLSQSQVETLRLLEENRYLIHRSMAIQEEERRYIARELHDEFGQYTTAIQADAETIIELTEHQKDSCHFEKIAIGARAIFDVSAHMYNTVHLLIRQLRPSGLDELGLVETLKEAINNWQARYPETHCLFKIIEKLPYLSETVSITLYRVVQECLTNVAKHAKASRVVITLNYDLTTKLLILGIQDNGCGIHLAPHKHGLGLIGIRERAQALNGHLQIESTPNKGTKIVFDLPITGESD